MMATMREDEERGEAATLRIESLIDQVDKLRREMSGTGMYAKLILSTARRMEEQVAVLIGKCSVPEASPPEEVVDLNEEEWNSGGMNQDQRRHSLQQGGNDELALFRKGMKNDCARLQDDVDNLLKLAQLLTNHLIASESRSTSNSAIPEPASSSSTSAYSVEPVSNVARRSPTSAVGHVKTGNPKGTAAGGALSPTSLDSTGDAGFTAGLEGMTEGGMSTMADPLDIAVGRGRISAGAPEKKMIRCRINSGVAVVPLETEEESSIHAEAIDPADDDTRPGSKTHDNQLRRGRSRRISSKPDMDGPKGKRTTCKASTIGGAKAPPNQPEVANPTRVCDVTTGEPESPTGTGFFDVVAGSDETPTVPSAKPGPSTQTQELFPETGTTSPKKNGVNADPLPNTEIESQPVSAAASSSNKVSPSLECVFCHKHFGNKWVLENHTLSHIGERPHFCKLCPYEASRRSSLKRHLETHKSFRERKFQCTLCQRRFMTQDILMQHIRGVHEKKRPFKCEECSMTFPNKNKLKSHKVVHTGEKNHSCQICHKKYAYKHNLEDHIRSHTGEGPKCRFCGKSFNRLETLQRHEESKHPK